MSTRVWRVCLFKKPHESTRHLEIHTESNRPSFSEVIAGVSSHPSASDFQLKGVEYLHFVIPQKSVQIIEKHDHLPPPSNSESPESVILIREKAEAQRSANEQKEGGGESLLSEIAHRVLFMFESAVATTTVTGKKNWAAALRTSKEALSAFIGVSEEKIKEVLIDDGVRCPEENVFIACLCWAQNKVKSDDPEVLRECLKNLLPHIRFPTLTEEQLVSLVIPTEILTKAEIVSIFTYQAAKNRQDNAMVTPVPFNAKPRMT